MAVLEPKPEPTLPLERAITVMLDLFSLAEEIQSISSFDNPDGIARYDAVVVKGEKLLSEAGYGPEAIQKPGAIAGRPAIIDRLRTFAAKIGQTHGLAEFRSSRS